MIVADSTSMLALTIVGHADLLRRLFGKVVMTASAKDEFDRALDAVAPDCAHPGEDALSVVAMDVPMPAMSLSESETIELCRQVQAKVLVSDDPVVRTEATKSGLRCVGTLGILYAARARGVLPDLQPPLQKLRHAGYGVSAACEKLLLSRSA